jgi:hypothetical protein
VVTPAEINRRVRQLSRDDILDVITLYRGAASPETFRREHRVFRAFKYEIVYDSLTIDAKAMLIVALRRRFSDLEDLDVSELQSTRAAVALPLKALGFEIQSRRVDSAPAGDLALALQRPAELNYDKHKSPRQAAQQALRAAGDLLKQLVPPGYITRVSGAAANLPELPWIAVLDSDQTTTAQRGIYLVYLYNHDLTRVYLSLNQGFTRHREQARRVKRKESAGATQLERALTSVSRETLQLRSHLHEVIARQPRTSTAISLGSSGELGLGYEAGHMYGFCYETNNMPPSELLRSDLLSMLRPYAMACAFADQQSLIKPGSWTTESGDSDYKRREAKSTTPNFDDFTPKDSTDVVATWQHVADQQIRSRKHEFLIEEFGTHVRTRGIKVTNRNIGKRDLLMKDEAGVEYLVEAKTVSHDGEAAVRDAIGQLFAYRHQYYDKAARPKMVALFNLPIDQIWQDLLLELEIAWIARDGACWSASADLTPLLR